AIGRAQYRSSSRIKPHVAAKPSSTASHQCFWMFSSETLILLIGYPLRGNEMPITKTPTCSFCSIYGVIFLHSSHPGLRHRLIHSGGMVFENPQWCSGITFA